MRTLKENLIALGQEETKLRIYNISVITGVLYAGESWTMKAADYDCLDAFDSHYLRKILGIRWHNFVTNAEVRRRTQQPLARTTLKAVVCLSPAILHI